MHTKSREVRWFPVHFPVGVMFSGFFRRVLHGTRDLFRSLWFGLFVSHFVFVALSCTSSLLSFGSGREQQLDDLREAALAGIVERRVLQVVGRIDPGVVLDEHPHEVVVPGACRHKQRRLARIVAGIDRRPGLQQRLPEEAVSRPRRRMQRSGSVGPRAVGVGPGRKQHPGDVEVPAPARHEQGRLARVVRRVELRLRGVEQRAHNLRTVVVYTSIFTGRLLRTESRNTVHADLRKHYKEVKR